MSATFPPPGRLEVRDPAGTVVGYYLPAAELARLEAAAGRPPTPAPPPPPGPYAHLDDLALMARIAAPDAPADELARLLAEDEARRAVKYADIRREMQAVIDNHPAMKLPPEEWIARLRAWSDSRPPLPPGAWVDTSRASLYGDDDDP